MTTANTARFGGAILATLCLLAFSRRELEPTPRIDSETGDPHPQEVLLLEELASWAASEPHVDPSRPFPQDDSLMASFQERSQSFSLFVDAVASEKGEDLLADLPYGGEILGVAERYDVDALLVASIVEAESSFNANAISPAGALGLMQVMPATALELGVQNPMNPRANLEMGARYLRSLIRRYEGNLPLALAAYNAGPGTVARFGGLPPYPETTRYVERVLLRYLGHRQEMWRRSSPLDLEALVGP